VDNQDIANALDELISMDDTLGWRADRLAKIVVERIDRVKPETLRKLKRALKSFDMHTGNWK